MRSRMAAPSRDGKAAFSSPHPLPRGAVPLHGTLHEASTTRAGEPPVALGRADDRPPRGPREDDPPGPALRARVAATDEPPRGREDHSPPGRVRARRPQLTRELGPLR